MRDMPDGGHAIVEVEISGNTHRMRWPRAQSLLVTLQDQDLNPPFSCETGKCGACACTLAEGEVFLAENEVLSAEDVADGYILACCSKPKSDFVKVTF